MDVESAQVEIRQSSLETLIEKVHYGVCQRGFSEKLWVEKRTDILIFSGGVYDDSSGKKILSVQIRQCSFLKFERYNSF